MFNLASILNFAYLFFGLIIAVIFVMASYNMFAKGYRPRFILIVIIAIAALTVVNYVAAVSTIQGLANAVQSGVNNNTAAPRKTNNNNNGGSGTFF
ncbi:MAG: hypothetical protein OHK0017_13270 [Patescibacteria group bacterium]